jgi:ankyrin repeat protein
MRLMKNLKNISVRNVHSIADVDKAIDKWQNDLVATKKNINNFQQVKKINYDDSFNIIGDQILLFEYLADGSEENNENILKLLNKEIKIKINKDISEDDLDNNNNIMVIKLVNHINIDGFTPLYFTCLNGHVKIVDLLIKNGGDHLIKCGVIKTILILF